MESFEGLTAEARIRLVALTLFAERGYEGTTVRAIADDAGVSPGLILHHFGSKEGLREAVTDEVVRIMTSFSAQIHQEMDDTLDEQFDSAATVFRGLFMSRPELGAYIRRLFFEADDAGVKILNMLMEVAREFTEAFQARGWMRPAPDEEMRNLQLIFVDFGPVLFLPLLAAYLRTSPFDEKTYQRWVTSQYDLFAHGVFTSEGPLGPPGEGTDE